MIREKKVLVIVPARSGSKGIKKKNLREVNGIPLLAYPIIAASNSKYVDNILFTSDSEEMCSVAKSYGANMALLRPDNLASDTAVRSDVIIHALNHVKANCNEAYDVLIYLEPTSPLTNSEDIDFSLEFFINQECISLVSITENDVNHPEYAVIMNETNSQIKPFLKDSFKELAINRQQLEKVYFFDGSIYLSDIPTFYTHKEFYHDETKGIRLDKIKSLEIDEPVDLMLAELIIKNRNL